MKGMIFATTLLLSFAIGCGKKESSSSSEEPANETDENGATTKAISADGGKQSVSVGSESPLKGSRVTFPPGSLGVDTNVKIEEGHSLATEYISGTLGLDGETITSAGPATVISSSVPQDASTPFTVQVLVAEETLALATELMVVYKKVEAEADKLSVGLIPNSQITISGETASFETSNFGVYQLVNAPTSTSLDAIDTEIPIATKADPPTISFKTTSATAAEDSPAITVEVEMEYPREDVVTVSYQISGSASEDDHGLVEGSFILPANTTSQSLAFNLEDDSSSEADETLVLTLLTIVNARIGDDKVYTLTITDND